MTGWVAGRANHVTPANISFPIAAAPANKNTCIMMRTFLRALISLFPASPPAETTLLLLAEAAAFSLSRASIRLTITRVACTAGACHL